jgi:hypothetical protein
MAGNKKEIKMKCNILFLVSEFLMSFIVENVEKFKTNFNVHSTDPKHIHDLRISYSDVTSYYKGAYYSGVRLFSTFFI